MKFRKKPVVINAEHFDWKDGQGIPDIPGVKFRDWGPVVSTAYIETLEGPLHVSRGDWIITGVKGERYPCKPNIFDITYEPVE